MRALKALDALDALGEIIESISRALGLGHGLWRGLIWRRRCGYTRSDA